MYPHDQISKTHILTRIRFWYAVLLLVTCIILIRLFYLQIIKHDYYQKAALQGQLKEYEVPASRGIIEAYDGNTIIPVVLNEKKYTLFADPQFIKDAAAASAAVQASIGGDANEYKTKMEADTRYAILAKKLNKEQKEQLDNLYIKGIGTREEEYRTYPQGELAAQLIGFVNDDGEGKYGIEQFLDSKLKGSPGQLHAITDAQGVPLVSNKDNVVIEPTNGERVVLTIDVSMQRQLEDLLKAGLDRAKSKSGSALIMDPNTGAIKAMANYPSYKPSEFYKVDNAEVFTNAAVSAPLEVGSIMKPLTAGAALDSGAVTTDTTYFDPGYVRLDNQTITNVEEVAGSGTRSIADILRMSLNTGAVFLLSQMGGGEVNEKARVTWHDYMVNHYQLGKQTGIEQGYEAEGSIPDPKEGFGLNIQYANTAFGQGMTATPLQMGAAISSVINGGKYYKPYLVDRNVSANGQATVHEPELVRDNVVGESVSKEVKSMMEQVMGVNHRIYGLPNLPGEYSIGGKTGTAQIPDPSGGYYEDKYNGMFVGFVGGDKPQYVIVVRVNQPKIAGYAGSRAAGPVFSSLVEMLLNNFSVTPKSK